MDKTREPPNSYQECRDVVTIGEWTDRIYMHTPPEHIITNCVSNRKCHIPIDRYINASTYVNPYTHIDRNAHPNQHTDDAQPDHLPDANPNNAGIGRCSGERACVA